MGLITSPGAGSGLDVNGIISAILKAESDPVNSRLQKQEARTTATLSGIGALKSALSDLKTALGELDSDSDFNVRKVSTSSSDYLSASGSNSSSIASYDIEVLQLAAGSKRESGIIVGGSSATFGAGQLSFSAGAKSFNVDIEATDTLATIRGKINAASGNFGVTASIVTTDAGTKISFASSLTGDASDLVISNNNIALDAISVSTTETQPASDAQIKIDGALTTSTTNTFTSIADLTIKLLKKNDPGVTTTVSVASDSGSIKTAVQKLVESYNSALKALHDLGQSTPGANGILAADSSVRSIESRLRGLLAKQFDAGSAPYNSLAALGVTTNRDGSLSLDSDELDKALSADPDAIKSFFTDSSKGFSKSVSSLLDSYISSNGILQSRADSLNNELQRIDKQREALNLRLQTMETRLRAQYASLDAIVSKFQGTSSFLSRNLNSSSSKS